MHTPPSAAAAAIEVRSLSKHFNPNLAALNAVSLRVECGEMVALLERVQGHGYDTTGRLSSLTPPADYAAPSASFVPVAAAEYGLPAGHWRHTATKGTAVTATYFDALWRPVMTRTYGANQEAATRKLTVAQFDIDGRPTYESYVARDITTISTTPTGTRTQCNALGRVTQVQSDSELGTLTATTEYLTGFQTRLTNPRAKITTQTFWALDDPGPSEPPAQLLAASRLSRRIAAKQLAVPCLPRGTRQDEALPRRSTS